MQKALYILGQLTDLDVEWLIRTGRRQEIRQGQVLIKQGAPIENLYIILSGLFSVVDEELGGRELARMGAGEVVGEMSFVESAPPSATVTAVEPAAVLAIPRAALDLKLAADGAFGSRFYRALALFLSDRVRALRRLVYAPAPGKAADAEDELDLQVLDRVHLAGARFERILQRLQTAV